MTSIDYNNKTLVIITGSSRGIGRSLSLELAKRFTAGAIFILTARSENDLNETKQAILKVNAAVNVKILPLDLSKQNESDYERFFAKAFSDVCDLEQTVFIHNAGQVGSLKKAKQLNDVDTWRSYFDLNFFSVVIMNSAFFKQVKDVGGKVFIINVTSLCGRQPFADLAMYGSGKAARELYFKVLAIEEPDVIILNYSPGPVDTDMFNGIIETAENSELRKSFLDVKTSGQVLTTVQTVTKLIGIMEKGDFKSGDTIDYFDRI